MVTLVQNYAYENCDVNISDWLHYIQTQFDLPNTLLIKEAVTITKELSLGLTTFYGQSSLIQGLQMAESLLSLKVDNECAAAAILLPCTYNASFSYDIISQKVSPSISHLIQNVRKLDAINLRPQKNVMTDSHTQIDRLRKLFLAIVSDIRVVLIKLSERISVMRGIKHINEIERKFIAEETFKIYAPLANRLGIGQFKWELEDFSFHYTQPVKYLEIAHLLAEKKIERDQRIHTIIATLNEHMQKNAISAKVSGRAKHIYSIYNKMQTKQLRYQDIYDRSAFRILVNKLEDCYSALSIVHTLWTPIAEEFDDYIASPKTNGYQSLHTAVMDSQQHAFEIQIRTHAMHDDAEKGLAAHWAYKENVSTVQTYQDKINFLRQLIAWHKETDADVEKDIYDKILNDRVYVFTPESEIIDLPTGSTPLDFAYHIHTSIGNRCRGALINDHIVSLTYTLQTGDKVEILTNANGTPSRDWVNPQFGYIKTSTARGKIAHWFRQHDLDHYYNVGKQLFEKEFSKNKNQISLQKITTLFKYKDEKSFLGALGRNIVKISQILQVLNTPQEQKQNATTNLTKHKTHAMQSMTIAGVNDLLTRVARCCKPIPGDDIIGFITQGRGVSLHKHTCKNMMNLSDTERNRLMDVSWDDATKHYYPAELKITANNDSNILKEITTLIISEKITMTNLGSFVSQNNLLLVTLTILVHSKPDLHMIKAKLLLIAGILDVCRV